MEGDLRSSRAQHAVALLACRPHTPGVPPLIGRVAQAVPLEQHTPDLMQVLPRGLAARFGGNSDDYRVASLASHGLAVTFPNWVARESAIARSPHRLENHGFWFSNWVETDEIGRGRLLLKAWIKLHQWPLLCWNTEDVLAAISGFEALWEVDEASESMRDVSYFRVQVRCQHVRDIPTSLLLYVEDRRFNIRVEIESWEEADPILLGEAADRRLGLDSAEAQDAFVVRAGFSALLAGYSPPGARPRHSFCFPARGPGRGSEEERRRLPERTVMARSSFSISNSRDFPPLPPYSVGALATPPVVCVDSDISPPSPAPDVVPKVPEVACLLPAPAPSLDFEGALSVPLDPGFSSQPTFLS